MLRPILAPLAALAALALLPAVSWSQKPGADDSLDRLLERLEEETKAAPDVVGGGEPKRGEVAPEDKSLDSLLEKLGGTTDTPSPTGGKPRGGADAETPPMPGDGPGGEGIAELGEEEQSLDDHLREILGRRDKKQDDEGGGQGGEAEGPLAEAIKKMEEVRKRLAEPDTGEETREKQEQIVAELDQILERLRQSGQSGQSSRTMSRMTRQAGLQQGQQQGQQGQDGNTGEGVGPQNPLRPGYEESLANNKDIWGDLPPQLREEMDNIFKEEELPAKAELIRRYFSAVAKKGQSGGQ